MSRMPAALQKKREHLLELLAACGDVVVAFSGGVDSTVLAKAAQLACGDRATAITALSDSLPADMRAQVSELAELIGIRHRMLSTNEFARDEYRRNAPDRCFFCKDTLYTHIAGYLETTGQPAVVLNGANADDVGDHRPGMRAASAHEVRSPLLEVGLSKSEVRALARDWGLPVWDQPAAPCLSSRIAYGLEVTPERVRRVDECERMLRTVLEHDELRVRHEANDLARIEVPLELLPRLVDPELRAKIVDFLHAAGFHYITLDLEGFRSGSLNAVVPLTQLQTLQAAAEPAETDT